ncbi:hypothetical protein F2P81_014137 [Scophthalmus maximus]|uniref:Izumo protein immunoglobulin domain-containing protein n=1 Tax=Scophthalmus maximus TaxID=52904 RepID=A0A6A4SST0_SCOMX|nr:hypothetical protein F2P81_014137 [Scophthalmus maximus]
MHLSSMSFFRTSNCDGSTEPNIFQLDETDFKALVVTEDSSVVLNQLRVDEQGTYRCSLRGRNGTIFYRVTFLLTGRVTARAIQL